MIDITGLLSSNGLAATVAPGPVYATCGEGAENLTHWKVDILSGTDSLFSFPVAIAREGAPGAPSVSEAIHFLGLDLASIVSAPEDSDWLALHGRSAEDADWLEAKREIEATSRDFVDRLPADLVDAVAPGLIQARAEVTASLV